MICVVDASLAVKWFAEGDWALREDHVEPALEILKASTRGALNFYQPPHFFAEVAAVVSRLMPDRAQQYIDDLAQLNITWASPTAALSIPDAVLVTADRRYFTKARHFGQIAWLPDFAGALSLGLH